MKVNLLVYVSVVVSPSYLNASQNQLLHLCINAAIVNHISSRLLQLSREDSYSASARLRWVFADWHFWTAWVSHRQRWSHTRDCKRHRHCADSHTTKCQAHTKKKGGGKNFSVKCVWDYYFYSISKLQRHHPGGSGCQDLNSNTLSCLIWWKPYTDPLCSFCCFASLYRGLVTRRALISSWTCPETAGGIYSHCSSVYSFFPKHKRKCGAVSEDTPAGITCGWCPIYFCCWWKHAGQCWQTPLVLCFLQS